MRVTSNMINDQVVFNLQRSIRRFLNLQNNMSTGRRINTPSDDPIGAVRDLDYRTVLSTITQYRKNVGQAQNWTSTYDSILAEVKNFTSTAKEIAVAMADGTYDDIARAASANEVQSLFEQIVEMGNSKLEGRQLFSGFRTKTKPLTVSANGVSYLGDDGVIEFDIDSGQRTAINLNGAEVFLRQLAPLGSEADLDVGLDATTLLADLNDGSGVNLAPGTFTVTDRNRGIAVTVDVSGATTINDAITQINAQLATGGITNLIGAISAAGNSLSFDTTQDGQVTGATLLARLNNGAGIDLTPGKIHVSDGAAVSFDVDLSGSVTLNDVITKFNADAQSVANGLTMSINVAGDGLQIVDGDGGPVLSVSETSALESTAAGLGLVGTISPALQGTPLNPQVDFQISETTGTTAADLGIVGEHSTDFEGSDLDPRLAAGSLLSRLRAGVGVAGGTFQVSQGNQTQTFDLANASLVTVQDLLDALNNSGLAITASINTPTKGIQIVNDDPNRSLTLEDVGSGRTAKDMGLFGSTDLMGSLLVLTNALRRDDQEGTGMLLKNLDDAIQHLLNYRATVGARGIRLDTTDSRLSDMDLSFTRLLSEVEDADMTKLTTDLATYENSYRAALIASGKIIQPTLLDFLNG